MTMGMSAATDTKNMTTPMNTSIIMTTSTVIAVATDTSITTSIATATVMTITTNMATAVIAAMTTTTSRTLPRRRRSF